MTRKTEWLNKGRENVFFLTLIICAAVFPFSEALVSISAGLILLQALILQSWHHPSVKTRSWMIVFFPFSVFSVYLIGTLFTHDFPFALYEWKKTIFWIVVPLAVFLSPCLTEKRTYTVLLIFTASVIISSFFAAGKLILHEHIMISDFRSISIVSHIRFSLQVVLSIIILAWFLMYRKYRKFHINPFLLIMLSAWLVCFLFLLKSLLGIISFLGTLAFMIIYYVFIIRNLRRKIILLAAFFIVFLIPAYFIGKVLSDFYDFKEVDPDTVEYLTPSGNRYHHDFNDKTRENGHLVYVYICEDELRQEWNKRSKIGYDELLNDFPLSITLIRYLTSLGYRKDSAGVNQLSSEDVTLIEEGITNYKFKNHYFSIYPRVYETIWEIDNYIRSGDPNKKSLAQRIEFIRASFILIKNNTLFGIGTGNWVIKYNEVYDQMKTKLSDERRGPSHNQYLNYIVKFGILGFSWILFAVLFPFYRSGHRRNFIFVLFLISYAFANLGDANMETHMGLSFFTFFYSIFLWNSTEEMKKSI